MAPAKVGWIPARASLGRNDGMQELRGNRQAGFHAVPNLAFCQFLLQQLFLI